jgi:hypothetical protein
MPGYGAATPADEHLRPKPAWHAIADALEPEVDAESSGA